METHYTMSGRCLKALTVIEKLLQNVTLYFLRGAQEGPFLDQSPTMYSMPELASDSTRTAQTEKLTTNNPLTEVRMGYG